MKRCNQCGVLKPKTDFYHGGKDGWCKPCYNARTRTWQKANPDKVRAAWRKADLKRYRLSGLPSEIRKYRSERLKALWKSPEWRESMAVAAKAQMEANHSNPEFSAKRIAAFAAFRRTPEGKEIFRKNGQNRMAKNLLDERFQSTPQHFLARAWHLRDPAGSNTYAFKNLTLFVRENSHLFDPADTVWKRSPRARVPSCRASSGLARLSPRVKHPALSWKGWTWNHSIERRLNGDEDLLMRQPAPAHPSPPSRDIT